MERQARIISVCAKLINGVESRESGFPEFPIVSLGVTLGRIPGWACDVKKMRLCFLAVALLGGLWFVLSDADRVPHAIFDTLDGKRIALHELKGKVILVNFWATTCSVCVAEMPELVDTYRKYRSRGFEVVAVAMAHDPPSYVVSYARKNALPFHVALDADGSLARAFGDVQATPTSWIIDRQGRVVKRTVGGQDFAALRVLLNGALGRDSE